MLGIILMVAGYCIGIWALHVGVQLGLTWAARTTGIPLLNPKKSVWNFILSPVLIPFYIVRELIPGKENKGE